MSPEAAPRSPEDLVAAELRRQRRAWLFALTYSCILLATSGVTFVLGEQLGRQTTNRDVALLRVQLDAHEKLPIHPGAATSDTLRRLEERLDRQTRALDDRLKRLEVVEDERLKRLEHGR